MVLPFVLNLQKNKRTTMGTASRGLRSAMAPPHPRIVLHRPLVYKRGVASRWTIEDLIDLEYLLGRDADAFEDELHRRDRRIYLALQPDDATLPRRDALREWLEGRRDEMQPLPGAAVRQGWKAVGFVVMALGLLTGGSLAAGLLHYTGHRPINVAVALGLLVGLQLLSLLFMAGGLLVRSFRRSPAGPGWPSRLMRGLAARASALAGGRLDAGRKATVRAYAGLIRSCQRLYGKPFFWSVFARLQSFGIAFNVALLAVLLFRVLTTDLAFGWQTTLQGGAEQVHALARTIAAPWAWLAGEGVGYPTLAAVEGSRIVLKDGLAGLSGEHLAAWWPFLCLAVFCYGLVPRLVLHLAGHLLARGVLARIPFRHAPCDRLYRRMTAPLLGTGGAWSMTEAAEGGASVTDVPRSPSGTGAHAGPVLAPHDLLDALGPERFRGWLLTRVTPMGEPLLIGRDVEEDREALSRLSRSDAVYVVREAWQPPIREFEDFLGEVRAALGSETPIWIVLAGRVLDTGDVAPARSNHVAIWQDALARLGDPYLGLLETGASHAS